MLAEQQLDTFAADAQGTVARIRRAVEVLRREGATPRSRRRAQLILKELGRLEQELPACAASRVAA